MRTYFANTVLVFQLNKYTVLFLVSVQSPIFWSHFTLKGPQVNFQVHTLNLVAYQIILTGSPVQKMHYFSHTVHCRCTSIHPLSEHSGLIPVSLRPASRKAHSALIGQHSKAWTGTAHRVSASALPFLIFFCNVGRAGDCIPVTSQPYGSPDSSFKGTRSEWISEWIWIGLRVLDSDNCFIIKKETEILLSTIRELHFFFISSFLNKTWLNTCLHTSSGNFAATREISKQRYVEIAILCQFC